MTDKETSPTQTPVSGSRPEAPPIDQPWLALPDDSRTLLIALIGLDFGEEPEKRIPEIKESRRLYTDSVARFCGVDENSTVLDLGSGCGFGTFWMAKRAKHVHGADLSPNYIKFASRECAELDNVSFHLIDHLHLDFLEDESIDVVSATSVFIHFNLYDIYWHFKEFSRVVKPGGRVWIDLADSDSLDLDQNRQYEELFRLHADQYRANPTQVAGLLQWNSPQSVKSIAKHLGFEPTPDPQESAFCKEAIIFVKT